MNWSFIEPNLGILPLTLLSNKILVIRIPSIWLTSFAITTLLEAKDQVELKRMGINIDTRHIEQSINWLISKQSDDGSFQVRSAWRKQNFYLITFLQESDMFFDPEQAPVELKQISVTSQALISLISVKQHYQVLLFGFDNYHE